MRIAPELGGRCRYLLAKLGSTGTDATEAVVSEDMADSSGEDWSPPAGGDLGAGPPVAGGRTVSQDGIRGESDLGLAM